MSEAIPGIELPSRPTRIRDAAVVVLVREAASGREVFWVRRGESVSFSRGFYAFPGGSVDAADRAIAVDGLPPDEAAFVACAARETFEETGVLLARGADQVPAATRAALRNELCAGGSFAVILERHGLHLDARAFVPAGRWVTPSFSPVRFDARFYLSFVPRGTEASIIDGELCEGAWVRPADALARWESGTALLHPPNQHVLATLAGNPPEASVARLRTPPLVDADGVAQRIEFQRGIIFLPLRTPTLPPAQHTNCYVIGTGELAIVDPGSPWKEEQDRLEALVRALADEGRRPKAVLLTHHHVDHVGGAKDAAHRLGIPILASAATAAGIEGATVIGDGEVIELDGPEPMRWRAVLTEGHARGHLCFLHEASKAVLAGDMVAGGSTIVIDPPEGDMGVYLASLQRLRALDVGTLYPSHGFPMPAGTAKLDEYLAHREQRMAQIRTALEEGVTALPAIVARVYADTPAFLHPVAERSARASLIELERRGQARARGDEWTSAAS